MGFKKNDPNINLSGRPKGAKDKKTEAWHELGEYLINEGSTKYMEYLNTLKDKSYAERFEKIVEYFKPKQNRTEIKADINVGPKFIGFEE